MLITKDLEYPILYEPALASGMKCNNLKIITGFTDCGRILTHLIALKDGSQGSDKIYVSGIKIRMILGMTKGQSLTAKKHKKICETIARINRTIGMPKIDCSYIFTGQEVHSKVYVWSKGNDPQCAFCGSANYTINAFQKRRECMNPCDPVEAIRYYNELKRDAVDCFAPDVESKVHFSSVVVDTDEIDANNLENLTYDDYAGKTPIDSITVSLLKADGDVGFGSGINWGIRPNKQKRNPDQAYIPYNKKDKKAGFFPGRLRAEDKNCQLFKVVTKEIGAFYMRLAQAGDKGIHSADSNAIIGMWIRQKLGVPSGTFITKEMLENYSSTRVTFKKYEDDIYVLEFEPKQ